MNDGIYSLRRMAGVINQTVADFPISYKDFSPGGQYANIMHDHEFVEIVLITAGHAVHIVDGHRAAVRAGDVLLIHPHACHGYDDCATVGLINIMYDPTKLPMPILDGERIPLFKYFFPRSLDNDLFKSSPEPVLHIDSPEELTRVAAEARLLEQELTTRQPGSMLVSVVRLLAVVLGLLRLGRKLVVEEMEQRVFPMGRILAYLNKHFTRDIALDDLVRKSAQSRSAFQYKFKNLTGYSVVEYIHLKRISLARTLLVKNPELSIAEVGFACGFSDCGYFSRVFRKITGTSPRQYRQNV